jgi:virginiamycin A acetyltransferase
MRNILKMCIFSLSVVLITPLLLLYILAGCINRERAFADMSQFMSVFPGVIGMYLRGAFYHFTLKQCSRECHISFGTIFPSSNVVIGKNVYIGSHCIIAESVIEDDVLIGSNVQIMGGSAHCFDRLDIPIRLQGGRSKIVTIGTDSWLGNSAIVMADVGTKSIVGAGSVVTRQIPPCSIAVGNPARTLRKRSA